MIVDATWEHAAALAPRMRCADREEVWAAARLTPIAALEHSLAASSHAWAWIVDGEVIVMGGAAPVAEMPGAAAPWLLGSHGIARVPAAFLRMSLDRLAATLALYPRLANWSDARHTTSHRWLRWLGFQVGEPQPFGAQGLPFRPFTMGF